MRTGPNAANRAFEKRLGPDLVAILTELLHWKKCDILGCGRCAAIDGKNTATATARNDEVKELFGKQYRDLSPEENREYHRLARERSRRRSGHLVGVR